MKRERDLPKGRVGRFTRMARLGARTGASLLASKTGEAAAQRAAEVLGEMRGLAAKIGQMASYVDGMVPEAHKEAYEAALTSLRAAAPSSSSAAIRALVEEELSAPIDGVFAEWDDEPFASASIGQVHRARLPDGRPVAVKVQHPGIERAVRADLANARVLQGFIGVMLPKGVDPKRAMEDLVARFTEELDYVLEAERQRFFSKLHAGDPHIRIPGVVDACSSRRVLTSELVSGRSLDEVAADSPEQRAHAARVLWRFVFKGNLVGGMFNADPHPGNYVFHEDGSISFLDFGCVQAIQGERQTQARALHVAALEGDEAAFSRSAKKLLRTKGGRYEEAALAYSRRCFEPLFSSPYRLDRAWVAELVDELGEMRKLVIARDKSLVPLPEGMLFMNRLQFGFYSVLARLDVEVDYAAVERDFLRAAGLLTT